MRIQCRYSEEAEEAEEEEEEAEEEEEDCGGTVRVQRGPYSHLVIDLKYNTSQKDRLHTEIFDTVKTMDEK